MTAQLKMDAAVERSRLDDMVQGVLGAPVDRPEGKLKVSGRATYADEWRPDGLVHGVLVRGTRPGTRVRAIVADAVRALPGILAVIADPRMLRYPAQGTAGRAPKQGVDEVEYLGQPVALVVAATFEQARHGALMLDVSLDPGDKVAVAAEEPDAVVETPPAKQSAQGDLGRAMREAAVSIDVTIHTAGHSSAPMEPHAAVAAWDGEQLTLRGSYQMLKHNRAELADALGVPEENVRLLSPFVGGGFGSKLGISHEAVAAAIAARELGRPVSVALSRQQVFEATMRRSETRQRFRLAADAEGRLSGIGHESLVSNLPGVGFFEPVAQATHFLYAAPNRQVVQKVARLHLTCAGSVRAPGEAVGVTALEMAMDELAEAAGVDPVELRLRNIPDEDPERKVPFSSNVLAEALRRGAARFGWERRDPRPGGRREGEVLLGTGMAAAVRVNMLGTSEARVTLEPAGRAVVETDMTDIGTGTYAILTQVAAEMLGLPLDRVVTRLGDTDLPPAAGSGGSWGAASSGTSVMLACEALRRRMAEKLGCDEGELTLKDGRAISGNRAVPLEELLAGETWQAEGRIEGGRAGKRVRQATWGSHFAGVGVSAWTGEVRVRRMLGVYAAGRILNAKTARSQCLGGMTFGIGMALTEELLHDRRDGRMVNRDFAGYHIPANLDVPALEVELLEERDRWANPMEAKGIGELSICGAAAAVANAIHHATGIRVRRLPVTPDQLVERLP